MSGTWNQLPCFYFPRVSPSWMKQFLGLGHRQELTEVARMWFAGCQRLGSVEMAKFDEILTPEKGGTCLNCPSVSGTIISILYSLLSWVFCWFRMCWNQEEENKLPSQGFCLLSNQMNSWGLVGSLSQPSRFFEVPCFFGGDGHGTMKLWGNVKSSQK